MTRSRASPAALWVIVAGVSAALHLGKPPPAVPSLQTALGIGLVEPGFLMSLVQFAGMALGLLAGIVVLTLADGAGGALCRGPHVVPWLLILRAVNVRRHGASQAIHAWPTGGAGASRVDHSRSDAAGVVLGGAARSARVCQ